MGVVISCISTDLQVPARWWRSGKAPRDNVFQLWGRWGGQVENDWGGGGAKLVPNFERFRLAKL